MASAVCFACVNSITAPQKSSNSPSVPLTPSPKNPSRQLRLCPISTSRNLQPLRAQNPQTGQTAKTNSILCPECEGNGAKQCTQCKGSGVNSQDHFNGQFKAGALCWLCRMEQTRNIIE